MNEKNGHQDVTKRRRRSTRKERLTPCAACRYPLSQRHHLLEVAHYGENSLTLRLCANCHELYHLIEAQIRGSARAHCLVEEFELRHRSSKRLIDFLVVKIYEAKEIKWEMAGEEKQPDKSKNNN